MKAVPVVRALRERPDDFRVVLVHTGQHYDHPMSGIFLDELNVGPPDHLIYRGVVLGGAKTVNMTKRLEALFSSLRCDLLLVFGDVNSTLAAALAASRVGIPVGHVEAGLRSFDWTMPEEMNRVVTDRISDLLFIHSPEARENLVAEGRQEEHVFHVGNTMIDTLVATREQIRRFDCSSRHGVEPGQYLLVTLHRPALVDGPLLAATLVKLSMLCEAGLPVLFPLHPRTRHRVERAGVTAPGVKFTEPLGYVEFIGLVEQAAGVLTDSGGVQEETTFLGVPCFTLRDNTERPITIRLGTNRLLGLDPNRILDIPQLLTRRNGTGRAIRGWDGRAAERLVDTLAGLERFATRSDPSRSINVRSRLILAAA
jgi:UDP-N-acetylglucosamine 2-epimerase (non-hydrolysing)